MSQDLITIIIPMNFLKFYGTNDEDRSLQMERYIKILACLLITNQHYYLVWFAKRIVREVDIIEKNYERL